MPPPFTKKKAKTVPEWGHRFHLHATNWSVRSNQGLRYLDVWIPGSRKVAHEFGQPRVKPGFQDKALIKYGDMYTHIGATPISEKAIYSKKNNLFLMGYTLPITKWHRDKDTYYFWSTNGTCVGSWDNRYTGSLGQTKRTILELLQHIEVATKPPAEVVQPLPSIGPRVKLEF